MSSRRREEGRGRDKERCSGRNGDGDGINANGYTKSMFDYVTSNHIL